MQGDAALHQITYFSRSLIRGPRWFVETELERLLVVARERNTYFGITGSLLFMDGCFAQILEGPAESIDQIYTTIEQDHRHADVTQLSRRVVADRAFGDFAMQYVGDPPGAAAVPGGLFAKLERALRAGRG